MMDEVIRSFSRDDTPLRLQLEFFKREDSSHPCDLRTIITKTHNRLVLCTKQGDNRQHGEQVGYAHQYMGHIVWDHNEIIRNLTQVKIK